MLQCEGRQHILDNAITCSECHGNTFSLVSMFRNVPKCLVIVVQHGVHLKECFSLSQLNIIYDITSIGFTTLYL